MGTELSRGSTTHPYDRTAHPYDRTADLWDPTEDPWDPTEGPGSITNKDRGLVTPTSPATSPDPPGYFPWLVTEGECVLNIRTGCVTSPFFPRNYGNDRTCSISIDGVIKMRAVYFETERVYDVLTVNGKEFSGTEPMQMLDGHVASGSITWSSDDH